MMVSTYESVQGWERKAWNLFKPWYFRICTLGWLMRILFFHSFLFSCIFKTSSWYCQTVFWRICKYFWIQEVKWKCYKCPHMSRANCRSPYFSKLYFIFPHISRTVHIIHFLCNYENNQMSLLETKQEIKLWPCFLGFWRHVWEQSRTEWREMR